MSKCPDISTKTERELLKLRSSVRRLVGALNGWWSLDPDAPPHEWVRAERIAREARDALVKEHPELSALIDGKDSNQEKL